MSQALGRVDDQEDRYERTWRYRSGALMQGEEHADASCCTNRGRDVLKTEDVRPATVQHRCAPQSHGTRCGLALQ